MNGQTSLFHVKTRILEFDQAISKIDVDYAVTGREVTDMIKLLVCEYSDYQIIVASIHEYDLINPKIIMLAYELLGF